MRLPVLALLLMFEPLVRFVVSMVSLLSVLLAFLFEFSGAVPNFPFWLVVGFAVCCMLALMVYEGVTRVFLR